MFLKNAFRRLVGNNPSGRSRSANPNAKKTEQTILSDSPSQSDNSLEFPNSKQLSPNSTNANSSVADNGSRPNRFKAHPIPELVSLKTARKRFHELHKSLDRVPDLEATSVKKFIFQKYNQSQVEENKLLDKIAQSHEAQPKPPNSDRKYVKRTIKRKGSVPHNKIAGLPKFKSNVSKSSELEGKSLRPMTPSRQEPHEQQSQNQGKELPGSSDSTKHSNSHATDQIFARNEAYLQKNRQSLANALKNIEHKDNDANPRRVPPLPIPHHNEATSLPNSGPNSGRSQNSSFEFPELPRKRNEIPRPHNLPIPRQKIKADLSMIEEKNSSLPEDKNKSIKSKLDKIELELKHFDQKQAEWKRVEIRPDGVTEKITSIDNEFEKIDRLSRKNSNALADYVAIRENLMQFYLKDDLKTHRNRRKLMKLNA